MTLPLGALHLPHTDDISLNTDPQGQKAMNTSKDSAMNATSNRAFTHAVRRILAFALALIVGFGGVLIPQAPFVPEAPSADAQTGALTQTDFGDCNYRQATGNVADIAKHLCWIDWSGITFSGTSQKVTRKLGRYTMTFDLRVTNGKTDGFSVGDANGTTADAFGYTNGSNEFYFTPFSGDTASRPLLTYQPGGLTSNRAGRFTMSNIRIVDEKGNPAPSYTVVITDGERTDDGLPGEMHSYENSSGTIRPITRYKAAYMTNACNTSGGGIFGPGQEPSSWGNTSLQRDFICYPRNTSGTEGSYLVAADNPNDLQITMASNIWGTQAVALAVDLGRLTGSVKQSDTSLEQAVTGQATSFDFKAYDRVGGVDTEVPITTGQYTTQLRTLDSTGKPTDSYVFKSTASGAQSSLALKRYEPVWTCVTGGTTTYTIKSGSPLPTGFTLTNTASSSEVAYTNPDNLLVNCSVQWNPRYQPATLQLNKTIDGTAAGFDDVALRKYPIRYECKDYNGFATAYPDVPLAGTAMLSAGGHHLVEGLPSGMNCTISEVFPDGEPAAGPGETHTLTWDTGTVSGTNLPTTNLDLATSNTVRANNTYNYRPGTLTLNKELVGDPVGEFAMPRQYQFEITCSGTTFTNVNATMTIQRMGTVAEGSVVINDVPVDRDCTVKPLTGLSAQESTKYKFDGRDVTFNGQAVTANSQGAYPFKLADYPAGGTPTSGVMDIVAKYSYQVRTVSILKQISGAAATNSELSGKTFTMSYRCTYGGVTTQEMTGTVDISVTSGDDIGRIQNVPVGASCTIYESGLPTLNNVVLDKTELEHADSADAITTLSNDEAKTTPILTVNSSTDLTQNRVVVTNFYSPRLGTVDLQKIVDSGGLSISLPGDYTFTFECGSRSVIAADDSIRSIPLTGTVTVAAGGTQTLVLNSANNSDNTAVNDQNGSMGVPYGNTCRFSETTPDPSAYAGATWETNATTVTTTVDSPSQTAQVTNTYAPVGDGLTITQQVVSNPELAKPVEYQLSCIDPSGAAVNLPNGGVFTLDKNTTSTQFDAALLPEGSTCNLIETQADDGTRPRADGGTFPIDRDTTTSYLADTTATAQTSTFNDLAKVDLQSFTIGAATVVNVAHSYSEIFAPVTASKQVIFDSATQQYISDARKQVKRERLFNVTLSCVDPLGGSPTLAQGQVSSVTGEISFGQVAVGSTCTATELSTTTAEGISVKQEVSVNGAARSSVSQEFDAKASTNAVTFFNTYSRRLADVELNKVAQLPGSILQQYQDANQKIPFYTHTFTMECRDPATGDGAAGALLETFTSTITGQNSTMFSDVPVGADCQIVGDNFGQLDLTLTDSSGDELHAHLRPKQVRWVVDKNDGDSYVDADLADGETTSQYFTILDQPADAPMANEVDLVNTYEYINTKIQMSKDVVAKPKDMALLSDSMEFDFSLQCKAVGYQTSTIGSGTEQLDPTLEFPLFTKVTTDADGKEVRTYTSPEVTVPAGSLCTFVESPVQGVPVELKHSVDQQSIEKRASDQENGPVESWDFVNRFERRTTPVDVSVLQSGYLQGIPPEGYKLTFTCSYPGDNGDTAATETRTVQTNNVAQAATVATDEAPQTVFTVDLPVGTSCELNMADSPALVARSELEVTAGTRAPFSQFNSWLNGTVDANGPTRPLSTYQPSEVTSDLKDYNYSFDIPSDLSSTDSQLTVAAGTYFLLGTADVTFTKLAEGSVADGTTFTFEDICTTNGGTFSLQNGESITLPDVLVTTDCQLVETSDGMVDINSVVSLGNVGNNLSNASVTNVAATELGTESQRTINFDVDPVDSASDTRTSGSEWALTAINKFPSVNVEKTIDGSPIGTVTGAVFDKTVLPDDATSMAMKYTVTNDGGMDLTNFTFSDPSLAGRTITNAAGAEMVVDSSGSIPATFCSADTLTLNPGGEHVCAFNVEITESTDEFFSYEGTVTVEATAVGQEGRVSDSDTFGAIRLQQSLGWMLPDTGMQTLLILILLGLLVLGYGLYRYLRRNEEDGEDVLDDDEDYDDNEFEDGSNDIVEDEKE